MKNLLFVFVLIASFMTLNKTEATSVHDFGQACISRFKKSPRGLGNAAASLFVCGCIVQSVIPYLNKANLLQRKLAELTIGSCALATYYYGIKAAYLSYKWLNTETPQKD